MKHIFILIYICLIKFWSLCFGNFSSKIGNGVLVNTDMCNFRLNLKEKMFHYNGYW